MQKCSLFGARLISNFFYREDLEKQEGCGVVAHERLTEPSVTMEWLLAKPRSISNLPAFLDLNGSLTASFMWNLITVVFFYQETEIQTKVNLNRLKLSERKEKS